MKKQTTLKIKAWAVLGYYDKKPMPFGSLMKSYKGSLSVFDKRADALKMVGVARSWEVVSCEITYKIKKNYGN